MDDIELDVLAYLACWVRAMQFCHGGLNPPFRAWIAATFDK
jgi:hypothetical protein